MEGICTWCAIRGHNFAPCMRRAPQQADANKVAIDKLSLRVDALSKSVDQVGVLDAQVQAPRSDVQGLVKWQDKHITAHDALQKCVQDVENWKREAISQVPQFVTHTKFDAFVAPRYADTERAAHSAVSQSKFDEWVRTKYDDTEKKARQAVPQSAFDEYVSRMEGTRRNTDPDTMMAPARATGSSRTASERDSDDGGVRQAPNATWHAALPRLASRLLPATQPEPPPRRQRHQGQRHLPPCHLLAPTPLGSVLLPRTRTRGEMKHWMFYWTCGRATWTHAFSNGRANTPHKS